MNQPRGSCVVVLFGPSCRAKISSEQIADDSGGVRMVFSCVAPKGVAWQWVVRCRASAVMIVDSQDADEHRALCKAVQAVSDNLPNMPLSIIHFSDDLPRHLRGLCRT